MVTRWHLAVVSMCTLLAVSLARADIYQRYTREVIPGTEMFIRQAAAQFKQFTGIVAPLELVRSMMP